jgi:hypothetical protein
MTRDRKLNRGKCGRHGITLIETMVLITGVAIALGLCAVTIQLLMRLSASAQSRLNAQVGVERLARQLRTDVHAASHAEIKAEGARKAAGLQLAIGAKHTVTFEPRGAGVARIEAADGHVTRREVYSVEGASEIGFEIRPEAGRRFVALVLKKHAGKRDGGSIRPMEVVALLGKEPDELIEKAGGSAR